ncbi:hypothetical protein FACS189413_15620 [Bacteroidia bacterium]|nr:hypothetical protein FACS189413_15620 [Bacteroidia bacterium]
MGDAMAQDSIQVVKNVDLLQPIPAETRIQEVKLGLGLYGYNQFISSIVDHLGIVPSGFAFQPKGEYSAFTPYIEYQYNVSRLFSIGAVFAFDHNDLDIVYGGTRPADSYTRYFYTLAVDGRFHYVTKPTYKLYSTMGLGAVLAQYKAHSDSPKLSTRYYPAFHVSLFGVSVGRNQGAFAEAGYGYKGFLNVGLFAKF